MTSYPTIAVSSASFAKNQILRNELESVFSDCSIIYTELKKDVMSEDELTEFAKNADYLLVGREILDNSSLEKLPKLKGISKYGVGLDNLDFNALESYGIKAEFESGVNSWEVTELAICLMVSSLRKVGLCDRNIHKGIWRKDGGTNLSGKTVGIIGFGHIGTKVAGVLKALGCNVLVNDILDKSKEAKDLGVSISTKEEIYEKADVITLHTPLTNETRHIISEQTISKMKDGVTLINTARGSLIKEIDLIEALKSGKVLGAGIDVFEKEPLASEELYTLENFVGTAHIGGSSKEASYKMGMAAIRGLQRLILDKFDQE